jgi:hypothetical protein
VNNQKLDDWLPMADMSRVSGACTKRKGGIDLAGDTFGSGSPSMSLLRLAQLTDFPCFNDSSAFRCRWVTRVDKEVLQQRTVAVRTGTSSRGQSYSTTM